MISLPICRARVFGVFCVLGCENFNPIRFFRGSSSLRPGRVWMCDVLDPGRTHLRRGGMAELGYKVRLRIPVWGLFISVFEPHTIVNSLYGVVLTSIASCSFNPRRGWYPIFVLIFRQGILHLGPDLILTLSRSPPIVARKSDGILIKLSRFIWIFFWNKKKRRNINLLSFAFKRRYANNSLDNLTVTTRGTK